MEGPSSSPNCSVISATAALMLASSLTSSATALKGDLNPLAWSSLIAFSASAFLRDAMRIVVVLESWAMDWAIPRPMPLLPPVTKTVLVAIIVTQKVALVLKRAVFDCRVMITYMYSIAIVCLPLSPTTLNNYHDTARRAELFSYQNKWSL